MMNVKCENETKRRICTFCKIFEKKTNYLDKNHEKYRKPYPEDLEILFLEKGLSSKFR